MNTRYHKTRNTRLEERRRQTRVYVIPRMGVDASSACKAHCNYFTWARILRRLFDDARQSPPTPSEMVQWYERNRTPQSVLDYFREYEPMEVNQ